MSDRTTTIKRSIKPVTITVTIEASRINENGTFSGFVVKSVKGGNSTVKAVCPPMGGGSIYLKVETLDGLTVLGDADGTSATKAKTKLF